MEEINEYERIKQEKEDKLKELRKKIFELKSTGTENNEEFEQLRQEYKDLSLKLALAQRRETVGSDENVRRNR